MRAFCDFFVPLAVLKMPGDFKNAFTESRMRYYRWVFLAAAAWNAFAAGAGLFLFTNAMFRMCALRARVPKSREQRGKWLWPYRRGAAAGSATLRYAKIELTKTR